MSARERFHTLQLPISFYVVIWVVLFEDDDGDGDEVGGFEGLINGGAADGGFGELPVRCCYEWKVT